MIVEGSERVSDEERVRPGLAIPSTLGRYTLFDFVGKGGMAEIYLGRTSTDLGGARLCVVKVILPEFSENPDFIAMLTREAKLAARLGHANVVQVYELDRGDDGRFFVAMEYLEGFDLNALLRRCSRQKVPLPMEFALYIVMATLRGLDHAHRRTDENGRPLGIVHRDVSPSNILISFDGEVKVCDFGIAAANDVASQAGIADETIKGKAGYMSPEQARGEPIDPRSDVFAAGIVLWELLAGRRLYRLAGDAKSRESLLELASRAEIPPLPSRSLPGERELYEIVQRALARDKAQRYGSALAMLKDLEAYALRAGRMASPLKLGAWLFTHFAGDVIAQRRTRERAAAALARGPLVVLTPLPPLPPTPSNPALPVASSARLPAATPISEPPASPFAPEPIVSTFPVALSVTPPALRIQPSRAPAALAEPSLEEPSQPSATKVSDRPAALAEAMAAARPTPPVGVEVERTAPAKRLPEVVEERASSRAQATRAAVRATDAHRKELRLWWTLAVLALIVVVALAAVLFGFLEPILRSR